jgi:hypothetical protein
MMAEVQLTGRRQMKTDRAKTTGLRTAALAGLAIAALVLGGCAADDPLEQARAEVTAKEEAVAEAQDELTAASDEFCEASSTYIDALDRYGDVLNDTAPTVGDVRTAGADLIEPRDDAFEGAAAAVEAQQALYTAEQELVDARNALAEAEAGPSGTPAPPVPAPTSPAPLVPAASVERVEQADVEFADAQSAVTDQTTLVDASEQFNSAAVALEISWLRLFADAGCLAEDQLAEAQAAVSAYTSALQQDLTTAGYYAGAVDGIYGPQTVQAVEALQEAHGLPVTGTVDRATAEALQADLAALGGAAAQESVASTAALQQTLSLVGFWDGPIDGVWTPELTQALQEAQVELGVEPTGAVDAATIAAFQQALAELAAGPAPEPSPTPSGEPTAG